MPTPVTGRENGHSAKTYGNPIGVECEACKRLALVPLDRLGNLDGGPAGSGLFKNFAG